MKKWGCLFFIFLWVGLLYIIEFTHPRLRRSPSKQYLRTKNFVHSGQTPQYEQDLFEQENRALEEILQKNPDNREEQKKHLQELKHFTQHTSHPELFQKANQQYQHYLEKSLSLQKRSPLPEKEMTQIEHYLQHLGHPKYVQREFAFKKLQAYGITILPLLQTYQQHSDPEIRYRIQQLIAFAQNSLEWE